MNKSQQKKLQTDLHRVRDNFVNEADDLFFEYEKKIQAVIDKYSLASVRKSITKKV